jgi:hypothetical protein
MPRTGYWADEARRIINEVVHRVGIDNPNLKAELRKAYPFGVRQYHPYKIWLREVKRVTKKCEGLFESEE